MFTYLHIVLYKYGSFVMVMVIYCFENSFSITRGGGGGGHRGNGHYQILGGIENGFKVSYMGKTIIFCVCHYWFPIDNPVMDQFLAVAFLTLSVYFSHFGIKTQEN